jgi:hypothetical protein
VKMMAFRLVFDLLMLAFFVAAFMVAQDFRRLAATFPLVAAASGIVLVVLLLLRDTHATVQVHRGREHNLPDFDPSAPLAEAMNDKTLTPTFLRFVRYAAWLGAFVLVTWTLGFVLGSFLFVVAFLRFEAQLRWWMATLAGVLTVAGLVFMVEVMNLRFPSSVWDPLGAFLG